MSTDSKIPSKVNNKRLTSLVERIEAKKSAADDVRSDLGNLYQEAEDQGFNRQSLKLAIKLKGMEADKRSDFLGSLTSYCEALGVWAQGDLFGDEPRVPQAPDLVELTPYRLGELAAAAGSEAAANPYPIEGAENEAWRDGWTAAWSAGRSIRNGHDGAAGGGADAESSEPAQAEPAPKRGRGRPRRTAQEPKELVH